MPLHVTYNTNRTAPELKTTLCVQGIWIRENRDTGQTASANSRQVKERVAIKELAEGTSPEQQRELVEEARVLASVQNYFCVKCARTLIAN